MASSGAESIALLRIYRYPERYGGGSVRMLGGERWARRAARAKVS
ncbi:hypothetical protein [Nocardia blacklockiae]|nr:hypothetical protein [Nocardia blacklockiae]